MTTVHAASVNDAYIQLTEYFQEGASHSAEGTQQGEIHEINNVEIIVGNPRKNVLSVPYRNMSRRYAAGEFALFTGLSNDVESFAHYAKRWRDLAKPDGTISSAYGYRMFRRRNVDGHMISRFEYALEQLLHNPESKNAIITMRDDSDMEVGLKDRCCTMYCQFRITDGALNMTTEMRSSDFWYGLPYDMFWYTTLMQLTLHAYNRRATEEGIALARLGTYRHICNSLHVYDSEWAYVNNAELPPYYKAEKDYEFPEYDDNAFRELLRWQNWEKRSRIVSKEQAATELRAAMFHPFLETMGSFLVNKINTRNPTGEDIKWLKQAEMEAEHSTCEDRKVGCVIVIDRDDGFQIVVTSYNRVIQCDGNCEDKANRVCETEHAEIGAIKAATEYLSLPYKRVRAYVTLYPCLPCRKALEEIGAEVIVKGFSHKGAVGSVTLLDPAFCW